MSRSPEVTGVARERVLVCGVLLPDNPIETGGPLSEAKSLVRAAGADVVGGKDEPLIQRRQRPDASTLMGRGKVLEVKEALERYNADAVMVDNDLSPAQARNLEKIIGKRVFDRSELIMDIFAARAKTRQAQLQVDLAQMEYMRPRLRRMWTHLERNEGAIGTRGPGETQLETDKRLIAKRIHDLAAQLKEIEQRKRRQVGSRSDVFTVGLIGYTNAGKSTLLNRVTGSDEFVADMPFATLDTRTRKWRLADGRTVLLSDTVGFLGRLPHHLVASFHATLEEALNVDMLIHVVDASHPDATAQMAAVESTLASLTSRGTDLIVLNKLDCVDDPIRLQLLREGRSEPFVHLSAGTGEGLDRLDRAVSDRLDARSCVTDAYVAVIDGRSIAALRSHGVVVSETMDDESTLLLRLRMSENAYGVVRRAVGDAVRFELIQPPAEPFYRGDQSA